MGYKILDVKTDIHEDVEKLFEMLKGERMGIEFAETLSEDICDIVDKHFEKIER